MNGWRWLFAALLACTDAVQGASLALCPGDPPPEARVLREYTEPDGRKRSLVISDAAPGDCPSVRIDAAAGQVRWAGLLPPRDARGIGKGVSLIGQDLGDDIRISEIVPAPTETAAPVRPGTAPLGLNILFEHDASVFGAEGRAAISPRDDGLLLECSAGEAPAGLLLRSKSHELDRDLRLGVRMGFSGAGYLGLGFSDARDLEREAPRPIGELTAGPASTSVAVPLPDRIAPGRYGLSVLCPAGSARLLLTDLVLEPAPGQTPPARAAWVWQPEAWRDAPATLLAGLARIAADTVFISVPLAHEPLAVADPERLGRFIEDARARGIAVWAVEGDPRAVLPDGEAHMVSRGRALAAFNAGRPANQHLAGVQYDIEPYLLPGFELDTARWLLGYLRTLRILRRTVRMPMEVAVPFWWSGLMAGDAPLLEQLAAVVDGVTVMNYRTDEAGILAGASPFLAWGADQARYVRIALEAGPIPEQTRWHFLPFERGRLWKVDLGPSGALILLRDPGKNAAGQSYALAYSVPVRPDRTTFRGRIEELEALLPELERVWTAWPSFAGVALHEFLPPAATEP